MQVSSRVPSPPGRSPIIVTKACPNEGFGIRESIPDQDLKPMCPVKNSAGALRQCLRKSISLKFISF